MGSGGSRESGPRAPHGPPSNPFAPPPDHDAPGTLTDVGGPFGHHVLVVVDAGIRDSGLGIVRRDHKEFLRGVGRCRVRTEKPLGWGWGVEPGLRDWGPWGSEQGPEKCTCVCKVISVMSNSATLWTIACQAPLSLGFSRQEY